MEEIQVIGQRGRGEDLMMGCGVVAGTIERIARTAEVT